jgi:cytochrome P450
MKLLMEQKVDEHEATIDYNEPRDFIDKVLTEMRDTTDSASSFYGEAGHNNLVGTLLDLFIAGSETTSTTLTWAVLFMAREPAVQKRVQV